VVGNVVAGSLGDRVGRRWVGAVAMAGFPAFVALFYWGPAWAVWPAWIGFVFTSNGGRMILRAFSTELFATDRRGTATGWTVLLEALSQAGGLMLLFLLSDQEGDLARFTPLLALATLVATAVLLLFPETRSRELDAI
jgi:MFS family permease